MSIDRQKHLQILAIAGPMILSNITAPLLGLVDTAVIGHLDHAYFLGGSTVGAMIITFVTWLCGFLRMSTTGLSAQAYGAQNLNNNFLILFRGLIVAFVLGAFILVFQSYYLNAGLYLAGGSEQVQYYARQYSEIRVWGLPAALGNIVIMGWLLGNHKTKAVMWLIVFTNSINLVLDLLFVIGFNWQVKGIASATLISEYSGLLLGLTFIFRYYGQSLKTTFINKFEIYQRVLDRIALMSYFKLNRDILVRTLCLEICFVFMTFQGARLGDDIVAANAILMNFLLLISFGLDGIANAAEVLVGKAKGENNRSEINLIVKRTLAWTSIFAAFYVLAFALFGDWLILLITDIPNVVSVAQEFMPWMVVLPIVACWCYLFDGVYIGLTQATTMRNSMLIATFGCFFPLWWLVSSYGNHGLWLAFTGFMMVRGLTLAWHFYFKLNKSMRLNTHT